MELMRKSIKLIIIPATLLSLFVLFHNCSPALSPESSVDKKSQGGDGSTSLEPEEFEGRDLPTFERSPYESSDIVIGPEKLSELALGTDLKISAPEDCEKICKEQQECSLQNNSTDRSACERSCNRETGLCTAFSVEPDPYTLTSFTVPAGYKKAHVILKHCTDRNDVLVVESPSLYFKTLNSGAVWNTRFGASVGRGPRCKKEGLLDHAKLYIQTYNDKGEKQPEKEYIWKLPGALDYPLMEVIEDMDPSAPVFAHVKEIEGPGVKMYKIYDNNWPNKQFSFVVEYVFWYDPKYVTTFDFYYKKMKYNDILSPLEPSE